MATLRPLPLTSLLPSRHSTPRASKKIQSTIQRTLAVRVEDELLMPKMRFRRAVKMVIRRNRLARSDDNVQASDLYMSLSPQVRHQMLEKIKEREGVWERELNRLTHFETITEPLSISFQKLTLTVGKTKIIQDLTGAVNAKATCALVRRLMPTYEPSSEYVVVRGVSDGGLGSGGV